MEIEPRKIFICECHSLEHQISFWYDEEDNRVITEVHLTTHQNIFKRFYHAMKYIFGYKSRYGNWDEFIWKPEDVKELKEYLEKVK